MKKSFRPASLCLFFVSFVSFVVPSLGGEPWATYRGNVERTGNTDGRAGPKVPKVLWAMKVPQSFLAAPVPFGDRVYVAGLGAFNVSTAYALGPDGKAVWMKTTPYLKLPTVSSPAVVGDRLVFGDGMHQTDGAVLHCVGADKGQPLWQLPVPGTLVHLEGAPAAVGERLVLGGGAAGVLCVDSAAVTLDGKPMKIADVRALLDKKWAELQVQYEKDKKKDPDFAVPPSEDQLPKPAPVKVWQQGEGKWHVDAPVNVVGERVIVASAFLDKEKVGDRAVLALDAAKGTVQWRTPLVLNPWGGASAAGDTLIVAGSSIGYDTKALGQAKGEITALNLADGKVKWRKDLKGGVVSCVAVAGGAAVCTATDGRVRAFDVVSGELRWHYDAKAPLFAPPAVAGGVVYVGDLKGVIHALGLADGQGLWTLDLGADPTVRAPGMIYAGPVVHGGRLIVATCNLEGSHAGKPCAVVCLGEK